MKTIQRWNRTHPKGSIVKALPHHRTGGRTEATIITSSAFRNRLGRGMVWLAGFAYPVSLQYVKAL